MRKWSQLTTFFCSSAPIDLSVTKARSEAVSFMEYFMLANNGLFIKNPRGSFNFQAYSEPVHYTTWMTVFIYSIFVPPIFALIAKSVDLNITVKEICSHRASSGLESRIRRLTNSH